MNTAEAFLQDIERSIANAERQADSQPRKGMVVYLDKSTPIMVQYKSSEAARHVRVSGWSVTLYPLTLIKVGYAGVTKYIEHNNYNYTPNGHNSLTTTL